MSIFNISIYIQRYGQAPTYLFNQITPTGAVLSRGYNNLSRNLYKGKPYLNPAPIYNKKSRRGYKYDI